MRISKKVLIGLVAAALCVAALTGTALAYFSDKTTAFGERPITLGYSTEINEDMSDLDKSISVVNTGQTEVMVRVQLFYSNANGVTVTVAGADGWTEDTDADSGAHVWHYDRVLAPGTSTPVLKATVKADLDQLPANFDVVVVSQSSPVAYDSNGNAYGYDWANASNNE